MAETFKICTGQKCGNCPKPAVEGHVVTRAPSRRANKIVDGVGVFVQTHNGEIIGGTYSSDRLVEAEVGTLAVKTVGGDGCYYIKPDGTERNPKDSPNQPCGKSTVCDACNDAIASGKIEPLVEAPQVCSAVAVVLGRRALMPVPDSGVENLIRMAMGGVYHNTDPSDEMVETALEAYKQRTT